MSNGRTHRRRQRRPDPTALPVKITKEMTDRARATGMTGGELLAEAVRLAYVRKHGREPSQVIVSDDYSTTTVVP